MTFAPAFLSSPYSIRYVSLSLHFSSSLFLFFIQSARRSLLCHFYVYFLLISHLKCFHIIKMSIKNAICGYFLSSSISFRSLSLASRYLPYTHRKYEWRVFVNSRKYVWNVNNFTQFSYFAKIWAKNPQFKSTNCPHGVQTQAMRSIFAHISMHESTTSYIKTTIFLSV